MDTSKVGNVRLERIVVDDIKTFEVYLPRYLPKGYLKGTYSYLVTYYPVYLSIIHSFK